MSSGPSQRSSDVDLVRDVRVVPLTAPYVRPDTPLDHRANGVRNCVWLRVETENGVVGWGEAYWGVYATDVTVAALERQRPYLLGANALDPDAAMAHVRFRTRYWAQRGLGAQATSAAEAALWDILGQTLGEPVWRLLGDGERRPVALYASAGDDSLDPPEVFAQARRFAELGYRGYKIRGGGRAGDPQEGRLERDVARIEAARNGLGPDRILGLDVSVPQRSELWSRERAETYLDAIAPYATFLEEPARTYDVETYAALQARGGVAVAGGESFTDPAEFEPFFSASAFGLVQPDAAVVGGPANCAAVCRRAYELGVPSSVHAWSAGVGLAQNLHVALSTPGVLILEWPQSAHALATEPLAGLLEIDDGYAQPPMRPGLGVEIDEDFLREFAYRLQSERDF